MARAKTLKKQPGDVPQYGTGSTVGSLLGAGIGALGFIGGPALGAMTMPMGMQLGQQIGGQYDANHQKLETQPNPQIQQPQYTVLNQGNTQQLFAEGGMPGGMNAQLSEIEKQEVAKMPNGQTLIADAPSHANGGLQLPLPMGTEITSDRLKNPNTGNTFAKDQAQLERMKNKIQSKDYRSNDKYSKNAIKILTAASDKIFQNQEAMKMPQPMIGNEFAYGGVKQYYNGDVVGGDPELKLPYNGNNWGGYNLYQQPAFNATQPNNRYMMSGNVGSEPLYNNPQTALPDGQMNYFIHSLQKNSSGKKPIIGKPDMSPIPMSSFLSQTAAGGAAGAIGGLAGQSIPYGNIGLGLGVANTLGQMYQSTRPEKIDRLQNPYAKTALNTYSQAIDRERGLRYDNSDMLTNARNSEGANNAFINRNIAGPARVAYRLANRGVSLGAQNQIYGETNRQNTAIQQGANRMQLGLSEMYNNLGTQDAGFQQDYRNMNLQQNAALRAIRNQGLSDLSGNFQQYGRDQQLQNMLPYMFPNANPLIFKR